MKAVRLTLDVDTLCSASGDVVVCVYFETVVYSEYISNVLRQSGNWTDKKKKRKKKEKKALLNKWIRREVLKG